MRIIDALVEESGCIMHESECLICRNKINWFAPVKGTRIEPSWSGTKAEVIVEKACITSGSDLWADVDVIVECPNCKIKNKFKDIKWKIK